MVKHIDVTSDHTCFAGGGSSQIMDRMTTMATGNPMLDMDIERKEKASYDVMRSFQG